MLDPHLRARMRVFSFTSFLEAFLHLGPDVKRSGLRAALNTEKRVQELDSLDPFANFTMGRSQWSDP